ncbi:hypothetical protein PAXRUDRAFT_823134 [Paxillus rubicundulus Ve08.2h10]|uniref:Uncharacterized protein n=1 Tax=Paxillus rubicundulus Ve08.2h10 TaxID=930991 RepID=A0A0D0DKQ9_9AGAM|nr:hypothetical protein PAXRUDRAFT_823134 [Paxillus rubicundulus Ve08.2h10]
MRAHRDSRASGLGNDYLNGYCAQPVDHVLHPTVVPTSYYDVRVLARIAMPSLQDDMAPKSPVG